MAVDTGSSQSPLPLLFSFLLLLLFCFVVDFFGRSVVCLLLFSNLAQKKVLLNKLQKKSATRRSVSIRHHTANRKNSKVHGKKKLRKSAQ